MKRVHIPIRTLAIVCLLGASTALAAPMTLEEAFAAIKVVQIAIQEVGDELTMVEEDIVREVGLVNDIEQALNQRNMDRSLVRRMLLEARDNLRQMEDALAFCDDELYHTGGMFLDLGFVSWFDNEELQEEVHKTFHLQTDTVLCTLCDTMLCEQLDYNVERLFREFNARVAVGPR